MARIFSLGICLLLLLGIYSWPKPVSAGLSVWSAETIPTRLNEVLGRPGIDVRDLAIGSDYLTIYAAPGNSVGGNFIYKTIDSGSNWTEYPTPITADLIAVAPDDNNLVVIANSTTAAVHISFDGGATWQTMGTVQETPGGAAAAAIYDIEISPTANGIQYIAAAGKEAAGLANVWYFNYGSATQAWHETNDLTGFATDNETATLTFSPSFMWDNTLAVITDNASITAGVRLQLLNINSGAWNANAGYTGYPDTIISGNITRLTSASLALSPTFQGDDFDSHKVFIGMTIDGDASANATSGIYRIMNTIQTALLLNVNIHSIGFNGAYLIAGTYDSTTVYRSINPSAAIPTLSFTDATKRPGGENKVLVAWLGSVAIAGTSGNESAFAVSADSGTTFDDISLIDTAITNARDVAVTSDGSMVYLVTDDGVDLSLWRMASDWKRVLSLKGTTNYIVRVEPSSGSIIYLAQKGGTTIYCNSNSGASPWSVRTCAVTVQDIAVESAQVAYALSAAGAVSKSITSGYIWGVAVPTHLGNGATIVSAGTHNILVGSQNGFVAYSTDGGALWTMIPQSIGAGAGDVQVVADESFATNKKIYAASDTPGQNIVTWTIGSSIAWTDIFNGVVTGGIYGLAITSNILYALEYNAIANQSILWRHISPSTAASSSAEWNASITNFITDADDPNVVLNATPRALKASNGKLWAVKTNLTNKLYSYTDVIFDATIELVAPAQGSIVHVNYLNGLAYDVLFTWDRPSVATEYELFIAYDENFLYPTATVTVNMTNAKAYVLVGPQQVGPANIDFIPGTAYYWKIRITKPGYSSYSVTRYFVIDALPDVSAQMIVEGQSGMVTSPNPAFSWLPLKGVTEYQFRLSDNPEMTDLILDEFVSTTAFKVNITLEYGQTYYWQVRPIKPKEGNWSALVVFTVAEEPTEPIPPVIIEEAPPVEISIPPLQQEESFLLPPTSVLVTEVTPGFFYIIIFTLAVLVGVVALMIYNTFKGRPVVKLPVRRPTGPRRKHEIPGTERARESVEPPKKAATRPPPIEKSKEGASVVFAAKSFMWMLTEGVGADGSKTALSGKEEQSLGKKIAERIHELTKKENLYIKHPEDAAMMLRIWLQYGSRDETNRYLTKTFSASPENAIRFLKCYLPPASAEKPEPSADDFTRTHYDSINEVVDPDKVYAALTKVFKFKADTIEEKVPVKPTERNLAFKFMRLHLQKKDEDSKKPRNK
ncbi:MAG: hypothetical protein JW845_00445 [Dehalococcoidales bacterium]|nr:hypothetical protein [Dehalococcoidales bacterium]